MQTLIRALQMLDPTEREKLIVPMTHWTLLNRDEDDLSRDVKPYSYKLALLRSTKYPVPVKITKVKIGKKELTIGAGNRREKGRIHYYHLKKKKEAVGRSGWVGIWFPTKKDGKIKIIQFGGL